MEGECRPSEPFFGSLSPSVLSLSTLRLSLVGNPRDARDRVISLNGSVKKSSITPLMHTRTPPAHAQGIRSTRATCGSPQQCYHHHRHRRRSYTCIIIYTAKKHHSPPTTTPSKSPPHAAVNTTLQRLLFANDSIPDENYTEFSFPIYPTLYSHHTAPSTTYIYISFSLILLITFPLNHGLSILYVYTLP